MATVMVLAKPAPINKQVVHEVADAAQAQTSAKELPHRKQPDVKTVKKPKAKKPVTHPKPVVASQAPQQVSTNKSELMRLAGIPESDYSHVDYIVSKESSWNPNAINTSSGARGLCQAFPASKMAEEGSDYLTNPITQLKWCHKYASERYGSWYSAFAFWSINRWW